MTTLTERGTHRAVSTDSSTERAVIGMDADVLRSVSAVGLLGEAGSDAAVDPPAGDGCRSGLGLTATGLPERPVSPASPCSDTGCSPLRLAIERARRAWEDSEPQLFIEV